MATANVVFKEVLLNDSVTAPASEDEWISSEDEWMMQTDGANDLCGQASYEDRKHHFKWAMYKFMSTEKEGVKTKYCQIEELKNSIFLSNFSEDHLKYWIKKITEFILDRDGTIYYIDP